VSVGSQPPDADLVARASSGDEPAFAELVRRHERKVYNLALRMLGREEDARDATQDAFVSCYRKLSTFRGDAQFSTWLHRIAVNACYDVLRRRRGVLLGHEEAPEPPPQPDHADAAAAAVDVARALQLVAVEYRAVLVLHDIQGWAYEDVAALLDLPLGTVKSRLHRGRLALGRALGAPSAEPDVAERVPNRIPGRIRDRLAEEPNQSDRPSNTPLP
jgi:RNA polymerase sigma-70 factor (ECF subfamily)